ncbi:hypothetical protein ABK040_013829 [Willaertia magna]
MFSNAFENFTKISFWIGFTCSFVGAILYFLGLAILKYAHLKNVENALEDRKFYLLDKRWWILFIMFFSGFILEVISFGFIEITLVASIMSMGVFIGVFYTAWYSAEKITGRDKLAVVITLIGLILGVVFSDKIYQPNHSVTINLFEVQISSFNVPLLFCLVLLLLPLILLILSCFKSFKNVFVSSGISSLFAGCNFILFKCFVELTKTTITSSGSLNQFVYWETYLIIGLAILYTILHFHTIQVTLVQYEYASSIIVYYSIMSFVNVCGGELIFREWDDTELGQLALLFVGLFAQFLGIYLLLDSHTNVNSIYPLTDLRDSRSGPMIKIADVDFDSADEEEVPPSQQLIIKDEIEEQTIELAERVNTPEEEEETKDNTKGSEENIV